VGEVFPGTILPFFCLLHSSCLFPVLLTPACLSSYAPWFLDASLKLENPSAVRRHVEAQRGSCTPAHPLPPFRFFFFFFDFFFFLLFVFFLFFPFVYLFLSLLFFVFFFFWVFLLFFFVFFFFYFFFFFFFFLSFFL